MSIRFLIIIFTFAIAINMYYDNYYIHQIKKYKKFYKIGLVLVAGLGLSVMNKKSPVHSVDALQSLNSLVNVMPIDKDAKHLFAPFMGQHSYPSVSQTNSYYPSYQNNINKNVRRLHKPTKKGKRSVSETKKKYVASLQNWQCKHCNHQLSAGFEVDQIKGLEFGGSNDVDNLQALCREVRKKEV